MTPCYFDDLFASTQFANVLNAHYSQLVCISDDQVGPLYADKLIQYCNKHGKTLHQITIKQGEAHKTRETKTLIEDQLFQLGCNRQCCLIALGGGVICDMVGFVAATFCRGVDVILIPTSLLAMVDAAHGGKTAINTPYGKNLVGAFYPATAIIIDTQFLNTLSDEHYRDAFAEVIKHAIVADADYFEQICTHRAALLSKNTSQLNTIIEHSVKIKNNIVQQDLTESHKRSILNFGHTFGHALEKASDYTLSHGYAVAIGMLVEAYLAVQCGLCDHNTFIRIHDLILAFGFKSQPSIENDKIKQFLARDKKNKQQRPHFVLIKAIGETLVDKGNYTSTVEDSQLAQALDYYQQGCPNL